jgi:DNA-binding sugar fermentation-stimulating protein
VRYKEERVLGVGAYFYYQNVYKVNQKVNTVLELVDAEKLKEAYQSYEDILFEESDKSSKKAIEKINEKLISDVEVRVDKYIDNAIDYQAVNSLIQELKPFESLKSELKDNQQRLDKFKKSKDAYENPIS